MQNLVAIRPGVPEILKFQISHWFLRGAWNLGFPVRTLPPHQRAALGLA